MTFKVSDNQHGQSHPSNIFCFLYYISFVKFMWWPCIFTQQGPAG